MNAFFTPKRRKFLLSLFLKPLCLLLVFSALFSLSACSSELDYYSYVSELRDNIFLAETEEFSLRAYSVTKEYPYAADGVPHETSTRCEIYLVAPEGTENCQISFTVNDQKYGGEMSFDNVKTEYYFSCTLDVSKCDVLPCIIEYGDSRVELNALSVLNESTLSPRVILDKLRVENTELFSSMTDKYGFTGEIYIRLIYEDASYYYVGVIDRGGETNAFLINATTGKIIAKRQT